MTPGFAKEFAFSLEKKLAFKSSVKSLGFEFYYTLGGGLVGLRPLATTAAQSVVKFQDQAFYGVFGAGSFFCD
jgi:hypothetical protein